MSRLGPHLAKYNLIYEPPKLMDHFWYESGNSVAGLKIKILIKNEILN